MSVYMATTKIAAEKTAQEINLLLARSGATAVLTDYGKEGKIKGLAFRLNIDGKEVPFSLPSRIEPVFIYLQKQRSPAYRTKKAKEDLAQAERVAWRQLLRWVQAQLALIDTGMVKAEEVFFPYIQVAANQTLFEHMVKNGRLALPEATV